MTSRAAACQRPYRPCPARVGLVGCLLLVALVLAALVAPPLGRAQETAGRRVFTYFFYWYQPLNDDPRVQLDHESLTIHHPPDRDANWQSAEWFRGQLIDMQEAGVDVALMVYWGHELYPETAWSTAGLEHLVQALDELDADEHPHPRIGLFFDSYVLQGANLTDPQKVDWLAEQVLAYLRRMPERHRATQDGRPIIWLYLSNFANDFDQHTFDQVGERIEERWGVRPFWVAERSWAFTTWTTQDGERQYDEARPIAFDAQYAWGSAGAGALVVDTGLPIGSVGPGYDDTALVDRGDERWSRPREGGCFYARAWRDAQASHARWVVIETWNELYEGSGVAETLEYGRDYIAASGRYSTAFKLGKPIPVPADCPEPSPEEQAAAASEAAEHEAATTEPSQPSANVACPGKRKSKPAGKISRNCPPPFRDER